MPSASATPQRGASGLSTPDLRTCFVRFIGEFRPAQYAIGCYIDESFVLLSRWVKRLQENYHQRHGLLALNRYFVEELLQLSKSVISAACISGSRLTSAVKLGPTDGRMFESLDPTGKFSTVTNLVVSLLKM